MKKIATLLIALMMVMLLALAGCAEYRKPISEGTSPGEVTDPNDPNTPADPDNPDDPPTEPDTPDNPEVPEDPEAFVAILTLNGSQFPMTEDISAVWSDGKSVQSAPFDSSGVARISGLDGDYRVTLSALPRGYTYNPNVNTATNFSRRTVISLKPLTPTYGTGIDKYDNIIRLNKRGFYRATLTDPSQTVFFEFEPRESGEYSVESWLDVTANEINPILDVYYGSKQWKPDTPTETIDEGGEKSTYTKNFKWSMRLTSAEVSGVFAFGLRAESIKDAAYPVNVDFVLSKDGEFEGEPPITYDDVVPTEKFKEIPKSEYEGKRWVYAARANNMLCDNSLFKLNEADGYYHLYDAKTDTYGPILFAKINADCEVIDAEGAGFTHHQMGLKIDGKNYRTFITAYARYTNSDGVYPVTEELKQFLQAFAISQAPALFFDGAGMAETVHHYKAAESGMWLFACGYYR